MRKRNVETGEPAVHSYRQALDQLRRGALEPALRERVSELVSLLELTTTLGSGLTPDEARGAALRIVMRELQVARAALFVRGEDGSLSLALGLGLPPGAPSALAVGAAPGEVVAPGPGHEAHDRHGLALLVPIERRGRVIALVGLGPREAGRPYDDAARGFLRSVAACLLAPIETSLAHDELRRAHQKLSVKLFELRNLFDLSRELAQGSAEDAVQKLVVTTLMGHFVVPRCALYVAEPGGLVLVQERGLRRDLERAPLDVDEARSALSDLTRPKAVAELPSGPLRLRLEGARLALAVPLAAGAQLEGLLAIGQRASGTPFSEEERELAQTLARHAQAALENARLQRLREEKERQDRELQLARGIQRSLLPTQQPELRGVEVAGESLPCYEVGGDSYDWIPLGDDRLALVIADVAGKGTPASLLMASVHAFVHALAGTAEPAQVIERLNRFLCARTQASRFVTLFYAELDAKTRRLRYVNAGHVPPHRIARDGAPERLKEGGPALGLLPEAAFETGQATLEPGDVVAMVTDGVTEATSPDDVEFGDERVSDAVRRLSGGSASAVVAGLVAAVGQWRRASDFGDDLTVLILKARLP